MNVEQVDNCKFKISQLGDIKTMPNPKDNVYSTRGNSRDGKDTTQDSMIH